MALYFLPHGPQFLTGTVSAQQMSRALACSPSSFSLNISWRRPVDYVPTFQSIFLSWWFLWAIGPIGLFSEIHFISYVPKGNFRTSAVLLAPLHHLPMLLPRRQWACAGWCGASSSGPNLSCDFARQVGRLASSRAML